MDFKSWTQPFQFSKLPSFPGGCGTTAPRSRMAKRIRNGNFSFEEKQKIVDFVRENVAIIEIKSSDQKVFKKRKEVWEQLAQRLRASGYKRNAKDLRYAYFRMKTQAKRTISHFKRWKNETGDEKGIPRCHIPSELDWAIADFCSVDFKDDHLSFNTNAQKIQSTSLSIESHSEESIDPVTGNLELEYPQQPIYVNETETTPQDFLERGKKKRQMSAFEEEILKLNKEHVNKKIINEELIAKKEMELIELKKQVQLKKLELLNKQLDDVNIIKTETSFHDM